MEKIYLVLLDDGGFWTDNNPPSDPTQKYLVFTNWDEAYAAGMKHRNKGKA